MLMILNLIQWMKLNRVLHYDLINFENSFNSNKQTHIISWHLNVLHYRKLSTRLAISSVYTKSFCCFLKAKVCRTEASCCDEIWRNSSWYVWELKSLSFNWIHVHVSNNSWTLITTSCSGNLIWAILNIVQYSIMYFVSEPYQSSSVCPNVVCQAKAGQPTCGPSPQRASSLTSSLPRRTLG